MGPLIEEEWRPIVGWEGTYEVSSLGRVWSRPRAKTPGGLLHPWRDRQTGYLRVQFGPAGARVKKAVHTLVLEAFVGPRPRGLVCRHLNGDPLDNSLANLAWGTYAENEQDKLGHGRSTAGRVFKTHCPQGHERTPENVGRDGSCKTCRAERQRIRRGT